MLKEMADKPLRIRLSAEKQTETEGMEESPRESMQEVGGQSESRRQRRHEG